MIKIYSRRAVAGLVFAYLYGCAPVSFTKNDSSTNDPCSLGQCVSETYLVEQEVKTSGGKFDIIIISDNSASMSFEQAKMESRMTSLLDILRTRAVDYRIGVTTTDVSTSSNKARAINGNGALQDGRLIQLTDGSYYVTPSSGDIATQKNLLGKAVKRDETLKCEAYITSMVINGVNRGSKAAEDGYYDNCPSPDERPIYAASMALMNNSSFLRSDAGLGVVIISDEDELSYGYIKTSTANRLDPYALETWDMPAKFIEYAKSKKGSLPIEVSAIIVKPADEVCKDAQSKQLYSEGNGQFGTVIMSLVTQTGGVAGSVCSDNYGTQLEDMGRSIADKVQTVPLKCSNSSDMTVTVVQGSTKPRYEVTGDKLVFDQALPAGMTLKLSYHCQK